ncbi:hypothetical protein AYO38_09625 [bacterium SCGC AG-212-C10]|nr:hypothetical protein AYO38_09625 [bacterium SCGC AG-212-C10]
MRAKAVRLRCVAAVVREREGLTGRNPVKSIRRKVLPAAVTAGLAALLLLLPLSTSAQTGPIRTDASRLAIPGGPQPITRGPAATVAGVNGRTGPIAVSVQLTNDSLASAEAASPAPVNAAAIVASATAQQDTFVRAAQRNHVQSANGASGPVEIARMTKTLNAVIMRVDASEIPALAALPGVKSVRAINNYALDLSETVPYIGGTTVQNSGFDGTGIVVAVLDSGVDYTHKNLGGVGTAPAYDAAYGNSSSSIYNRKITRGVFPTAKVISGYDFVGETWGIDADGDEIGVLAPDPNPIDCGVVAVCEGGGHGTHVADIIAGLSRDGTHKGVAPGAKIMAIKVCSSISTSCSGVALLQAVEYAVDPNGDLNTSDAAHVLNLSLGSSYGQVEDDLSFALKGANDLGSVVVASAGNAADRPVIAGSPSTQLEVLSVAQTQVPSAKGYTLTVNSPAGIAGEYKNTVSQAWAPIVAGFTGNLVLAGNGCTPASFPANTAGKVALIDRGICAVSVKSENAKAAGAVGALVGLVASGDPVGFSQGSPGPFVETLVISQALANLLKANIAAPVNVTVSPANFTSLVGSLAGSSSRGPGYSFGQIKPNIGAPGASLSALVGTGTGQEAFSGTSGAAPMVSGAAALVRDAKPGWDPIAVRSALVNTAETQILTNPLTLPGGLAPITRIGGGEVRVDRAVATQTLAWAISPEEPAISFGEHRLSADADFSRTVRITNDSASARLYTIASAFRYAEDQASGAVTLSHPPSVNVPANSSADIVVNLHVNAANLPGWILDGGPNGGEGALLNLMEFDGYLNISGGGDNIHLPWQILPHKASNANNDGSAAAAPGPDTFTFRGSGVYKTHNYGVEWADADVFSLTHQSPALAGPPPAPGDNEVRIDLKSVGVRQVGNAVQFAVSTYGEHAHPAYPAEIDVYIDSDSDGDDDFAIFTLESGAFGSTGQTVVAAVNLNTGAGGIFYYAAADLYSTNVILTAPLAAVGLTPSTQFKFRVEAFDNYFQGVVTDATGYATFTLNKPRIVTAPAFSVAPGSYGSLMAGVANGGSTASPSQLGLLIFWLNGREGAEEQVVLIP